MITRIKVSNFRSLGQNIIIEPGNLNFFIGTNGSGKSNTLHVLTFIQEAVKLGLPGAITNNNGIDSIRRHSSGHPRNVSIELSINLPNVGASVYGFELTGDKSEEYRIKREWAKIPFETTFFEYKIIDQEWYGPENLKPSIDKENLAITSLGGDERIKPLWDFLSNMITYSIYPDILRIPQKFTNELPLKSRGENWLSVIHQQQNRDWIKDLGTALFKLTNDIDAIKTEKAAGFLVAEFRHQTKHKKGKKWYGAHLESDGTLRVAGLLTALLQEPRLPVVGIEEPELTVHPGAIPMIYDHLLEASKNTQIFVTTHSPILLDYLSIEQSKIFVVEKKENTTYIKRLSSQSIDRVKKQLMSLGEILTLGFEQTYINFNNE